MARPPTLARPAVAVVLGTRPEAIKMIPVIRALKAHAGQLDCAVISTGQHRQMLDQILGPFGIAVDRELEVMEPNQSLFKLSAKAIVAFEDALRALEPAWLLVQGDTTTAFLGALCAYYRQIPVGHVEAGLRTGNKHSPFPEEGNRRLIGQLADLHFAPTPANRRNLLAEGIADERVLVTGNTGIDTLLSVGALATQPALPAGLAAAVEGKRLVLVTAHRRESFGGPMRAIFEALAELAAARPELAIVYPVHLNPNVQAPARELLSGIANVHLVDPLEYLAFVQLMAQAELVLTDSGGVQEEAPSLGVPVLVLRNETERTEALLAGTVKLAGTERATIVREALRLLDDPEAQRAARRRINPYGDGRAAERIVQRLLGELGLPAGPPLPPFGQP